MTATPNPGTFDFRGLHENVQIGTTSDRYAGWIGQIYSQDRYAGRISRRSKSVGGKTFSEQVLPVDSVEEYFQHFPVLELDFTFYRFLLDQDSKPTQSYHVLRKYRDHLGNADRLILKVPQAICSENVRTGRALTPNPHYLNSQAFVRQFYAPAEEVLGHAMTAMVFEQAYLPKRVRPSSHEYAEAWDQFFKKIPKDCRYHVEVRTEALLTREYFDVLERHGAGQVLSHWTWLPPLAKQFSISGRGFLNAGRHCVVRLVTPRRLRYDESYRMAYPFNRLVDGMLDPRMLDDAVEIVSAAINKNVTANVMINNRAGGNAPLIARSLAHRLIESLASG